MVTPDNIQECSSILQRAIKAYEGLMQLYTQDAPGNMYFDSCLAEARTKRNGLLERLANPVYLADTFKDNYYHSIDHFLESHRGEYGFDMPGSDPVKASLADTYLKELSIVIDDIIRVKRARQDLI